MPTFILIVKFSLPLISTYYGLHMNDYKSLGQSGVNIHKKDKYTFR